MEKRKNRILIIALLALLLVVLCVLGILLIFGTSHSKYEQQVNTAVKYFESAEYDNAILQFEDVIRQDEDNERAYEGVAEAYAAKNDYLSAIHWLTIGVEKTKSSKLKKMLADYQTLISQGEKGYKYEINDVVAGSSGVTIYSDMLLVLNAYTYGDYSSRYTFTGASTDTVKELNELPIILNFAEAPEADVRPVSASVKTISYLFTGFVSGVSYERLEQLGLDGLMHGYNAELGCEAVEFNCLDCHIAVECDENGNITSSSPVNLITFLDRTNGIGTDTATEPVEEDTTEEDTESLRTFKGVVYDGDTGKSAGAVHMSIFSGKQSAKGKLYKKLDTNSGGDFNVELPYGDYSIEITASGFIKYTEEVTVRQSDSVTIKDFHLSREGKSEGTIKIVLTWGRSPRDIDSYLVGKTGSGKNVESWFGNKTNTASDGTVISTLDIDEMRGNGKETTILYDTSGSYTFYVKNFSREAPLSSSGAVVKVYEGDSSNPTETVTIPSDLSGNIWEVLKIEDGKVTVTNKAASSIK